MDKAEKSGVIRFISNKVLETELLEGYLFEERTNIALEIRVEFVDCLSRRIMIAIGGASLNPNLDLSKARQFLKPSFYSIAPAKLRPTTKVFPPPAESHICSIH